MTKMTKMTKSVAKKDEGEMTFSQDRPDYMTKDNNRGQENVNMDDLAIPRLDVLQSLSPQRKKGDPEYINGAEEGMLFNTVTKELYGDSVLFVPVYYTKEWLIWKAQDAGGGLEGAYDSESAAVSAFKENGFAGQTFKKGKFEVDMYEIVDTGNQFGFIVRPDGTTEDIVISMSKSKMKVNRALNTLIKMAGGDRFSRVYKVEAISDQNKQNQAYFNLKVSVKGFVTEKLYRYGEERYETFSSSKVAYSGPKPKADERDDEY